MPFHNEKIIKLGFAAEIAFWQAMAIEQRQVDDIIIIVAGLNDPYFNLAINCQVLKDPADEKISEIIQYFRARKITWSWLVGPLAGSVILHDQLKKYGFSLLSNSPGMYFALNKIFPHLLYLILKFVKQVPDDQLKDWIIPVSKGFDSKDGGEQYRMLNANIRHGEGTSFRHFIGYYKNVPVSGITLFINKDSVMLHNLATDPDYRGRKFATALALYAMNEAKKQRLPYCFLDASAEGLKLYQSLGFEIYGGYQHYIET